MSHKHLTPEQRKLIAVNLASGLHCTEIAKHIGCHKSTVSREIRRNGGYMDYSGVAGDRNYRRRRQNCRQELKLSREAILRDTIEDRLLDSWPPEQIVGRLHTMVSVPTIYRAIRRGVLDKQCVRHLRCGGRPYKTTVTWKSAAAPFPATSR